MAGVTSVGALADQQYAQLKALASMAKGSSFFGKASSGRGYIGSFVDKLTGETHYVKIATHWKERKSLAGALKDGSTWNQLSAMSDSLKDDLRSLAKQVGVEDEFNNLVNARKEAYPNLMSRNFVFKAVNLIAAAHNRFKAEQNNPDDPAVFAWDNVIKARSMSNTKVADVLKDVNILASQRSDEERQTVTRTTYRVGVDQRADMDKVLDTVQNNVGGKLTQDDVAMFLGRLDKGFIPAKWAEALKIPAEQKDLLATGGANLKEAGQAFEQLMISEISRQLKNATPESLAKFISGDVVQQIKKDATFAIMQFAQVNEGAGAFGQKTVQDQLKILLRFKSVLPEQLGKITREKFSTSLARFAKMCANKGAGAFVDLEGFAKKYSDKMSKELSSYAQKIAAKDKDAFNDMDASLDKLVNETSDEVKTDYDKYKNCSEAIEKLKSLRMEIWCDQLNGGQRVQDCNDRLTSLTEKIAACEQEIEKLEQALTKEKARIGSQHDKIAAQMDDIGNKITTQKAFIYKEGLDESKDPTLKTFQNDYLSCVEKLNNLNSNVSNLEARLKKAKGDKIAAEQQIKEVRTELSGYEDGNKEVANVTAVIKHVEKLQDKLKAGTGLSIDEKSHLATVGLISVGSSTKEELEYVEQLVQEIPPEENAQPVQNAQS